MSDDPWWPEGYAHPAFQLQRQAVGLATGGDYVRGSGVAALPQTALRYPVEVEGFADVRGQAYLTIRPFDYITAQIAWGWPVKLEEKWTEVALVRSGFGVPLTTNDGQTVFRALRSDFDGLDEDGNPVSFPPPVVLDQPLQSGHWYYYTLFFQTGNINNPSWTAGMTGQVLIPRNYKHSEHLWNAVPPFYQFSDSDPRGQGRGLHTLERWLTVFGFELDQTREFVEQWQHVYHIDLVPMPLLKGVGANLGEPYHSGIGEIRYRAFMAGLPDMLETRGTVQALKYLIEAVSKFQCDIGTGSNLMVLPDDSDFFYGTGSWAGIHPDVLIVTSLWPTDINLASSGVPPPVDSGRGTMRVKTGKSVETTDFSITCGCGIYLTREIVPLYTGVPIEEGGTYGFSIKAKHEVATNVQVTASLLWFDKDGQPVDYLSLTAGTPTTVSNSWTTLTVQGAAPEAAVYLVPVVQFSSRPAGGTAPWSYYVDLAGAMVYLLAEAGSVAVAPPDSYLTLGVSAEKLGDPVYKIGSN